MSLFWAVAVAKLGLSCLTKKLCMFQEVFFAKINQAVKDIEDGKGIVIENREELIAYFNSL